MQSEVQIIRLMAKQAYENRENTSQHTQISITSDMFTPSKR